MPPYYDCGIMSDLQSRTVHKHSLNYWVVSIRKEALEISLPYLRAIIVSMVLGVAFWIRIS